MIFMAFIAGFLSFVSPCVLPLIPAYLAYMTGVSLKEQKLNSLIHAVFFVLGFSTIFILLGASATFLGGILVAYRGLIRQAGGVIVIIFGIYIMGILKIPFLDVERKILIKNKPAGLFGSFLIGLAFAAGWTPCIGPILASILVLASASQTISSGILLLCFYSLGLGLPFLLTSLAIERFLIYFDRFKKYLGAVSVVSGIFLIIIGILLLTDHFQVLYFIK